jgi:predicted nucleic acid-binding protein
VRSLDAGERAAILLARELGADLLLIDDREGVAAAQGMGLAVTGTIGLLYLAARRGPLDLSEAFKRLRHTSFRCPDRIIVELLNRFERDRE